MRKRVETELNWTTEGLIPTLASHFPALLRYVRIYPKFANRTLSSCRLKPDSSSLPHPHGPHIIQTLQLSPEKKPDKEGRVHRTSGTEEALVWCRTHRAKFSEILAQTEVKTRNLRTAREFRELSRPRLRERGRHHSSGASSLPYRRFTDDFISVLKSIVGIHRNRL
jgi:hypothetical protein